MAENSVKKILEQPAYRAAPLLLGCILSSSIGGKKVSGIISEVEAYDQTDPASHTHSGRTDRNKSMFMRPGTVYVYFTYGMHYCMNFSTFEEGKGSGVLIRSIRPLTGIDTMWWRRYGDAMPLAPSNIRMKHLTDGPAKLTQALGIGRHHDGLYMFDADSPVSLELPDSRKRPVNMVQTPRIGLSKAKDTLWRWVMAD